MIDIKKAKQAFKKYISNYKQDELGYNLKVVHTYKVVDNSNKIANLMNLSKEDIKLAELIALLHDIGRFEELKKFNQFESVKFDHANYGAHILFDEGLIRNFIEDDKYDLIIKKAIINHNKYKVEDNLDERELLHSKIIRDADKLDNFRVKETEKIETIFPGKVKTNEEMENSTISDKVYHSIMNNSCIDIHDRKTPLDYWICVLAFIFDINYKETLIIINDNNYVDKIIDRFDYTKSATKKQMEKIRIIIKQYINEKIR